VRAPLFNIPQRGEAPTAFFRALSEADGFCDDLDRVRELQCRVNELESENRELRLQLAQARGQRDAFRMSGDAR
jgi:hypothetical protein